MEKGTEFRVSAEELALALSLVGRPDVAKGLLVGHFGLMEEAHMHSRLYAAGHSLMSKALLSVDASRGQSRLDDNFADVVSALAECDFTIRFTRSQDDVEQHVAYHIRGATIVEHRVAEGVVHVLTRLSMPSEITDGGMAFFRLGEATPFPCTETDVPLSVFDQATKRGLAEPAVIGRMLRDAGVSEATARILAEDCSQTVYRGSGLRIEYQAKGRPISNRGFMVLRGQNRFWLFRLTADDATPMVRIRAGTARTFTEEVRRLLEEARS